MFGSKVPIALIRQLFNLTIINVLFEIVEFCRKDGKATYFEAIKHIHKNFSIVAIVIDEAWYNDEVELIFIFWFDLVVWLTDDHSFQVLVSIFAFRNLDKIITAVDATDVVEALCLEVARNEAFTAAHFEYFAFHPIHGT
jgi:hypothetical protein